MRRATSADSCPSNAAILRITAVGYSSNTTEVGGSLMLPRAAKSQAMRAQTRQRYPLYIPRIEMNHRSRHCAGQQSGRKCALDRRPTAVVLAPESCVVRLGLGAGERHGRHEVRWKTRFLLTCRSVVGPLPLRFWTQ